MVHHTDSSVIDTVVQLLSGAGFAHMAEAVRILHDDAMKIERSHVPGARSRGGPRAKRRT